MKTRLIHYRLNQEPQTLTAVVSAPYQARASFTLAKHHEPNKIKILYSAWVTEEEAGRALKDGAIELGEAYQLLGIKHP